MDKRCIFQLSGMTGTWNLIIINVDKSNTMTPNFEPINQIPWRVTLAELLGRLPCILPETL